MYSLVPLAKRSLLPTALCLLIYAPAVFADGADTTAPDPPLLSATPSAITKSKSASIGFTSEPNAVFTCSVDNGTFGPCTSPKALTNLPDGLHSLAVKATDQAGNTSAASTAAWTVDTSPPSAPALSDSPPTFTQGKTASVTFTAEADVTFSCSVDGAPYESCASPKSLADLTDGAHSVAVTATDQAGNVSSPATVRWTVDTVAPGAPTLFQTPTLFMNVGSAAVGFASEAGATFVCSLDDGPYAACASKRQITGLIDGPHWLLVKSLDQAGNESVASIAAWNVDTVKPQKPTSVQVLSAGGVRYIAQIGGVHEGSIKCQIDRGIWKRCTATQSLPNADLKVGTHQLTVKVEDAAGNASPLSISQKFTVQPRRCSSRFNLREGPYLDTFKQWNSDCGTARAIYQRLNLTRLPKSFLPRGGNATGTSYTDLASGYTCKKKNNGSRQKFTITCNRGNSQVVTVST